MKKDELTGKLQMVYIGDKNAMNELIDYYDELQQNINKIMEIIELNQYSYGYQIKEEILKDSDVNE